MASQHVARSKYHSLIPDELTATFLNINGGISDVMVFLLRDVVKFL